MRLEFKDDGTLLVEIGQHGSGDVFKIREDPLHPGALMISGYNVDNGEMIFAFGEKGEPARYLGCFSVVTVGWYKKR